MKTIPEQLVDIYENYEWWHKTRMTHKDSIQYHKSRYENGDIQVYEEYGEVLGYYERYFTGDTCILYNVYVKKDYRRGEVFKQLKKLFFLTLPLHITHIEGEKQKLGGKIMKALITKRG